MHETERLHVHSSLADKRPVVLNVKVVPCASHSEVAEIMADRTWRVKLAAVPEKGKANEELRRFLADYLQVRRDQVELLTGAASTRKRVRISP